VTQLGHRQISKRFKTRSPVSCRDRNLQRERVDAFVPIFSHDESVAKENSEHAIGSDRVGLGHDYHVGFEHHVALDPAHVLGGDMRIVGDEVDTVALGWARLHSMIAEEFARRTHSFRRLARRDLGDDFVVAR
jgi:hypothetical protein